MNQYENLQVANVINPKIDLNIFKQNQFKTTDHKKDNSHQQLFINDQQEIGGDQIKFVYQNQKVDNEVKEVDKENNKIERLNSSSYRLNSVFDK